MIRAGSLTHLLSLQQRQTGRDPDSGAVINEAWIEIGKLWARIEPLSVRAFIAAAAEQSEISAHIVTYRDPRVKRGMRFVGDDGSIYRIAAALSDKKNGHEYQTHPVSEGVNDGK
ncbi:head-tail adaptor protein [Comamonas testosteroni TK102]|uniref:Head-tail adaptor protein n=1 Tax=Comamonas testosteroni TK102 TaxID=1392005 RepID=A0A076PIX4_COMTE|nr:phage head closure protein [Comamonas testosteroni]AIJ45563.1 head-tail adaptor protein [Comamonas testosteroni TK102]